jgi:hypothetical protein
MTISYPVSMPSSPALAQVRFTARSTVGVAVSPFTGQQQVYAHAGQWWEAEVTLPPMTRAQAEPWIGFLMSLRGREGTFLMGDPLGIAVRGVGTGTPLVKGAGQTGQTLVTDGWTISQTGILKAGDWMQIGSGSSQRLYRVVQDANSDGSGNATFDLWPRLRESPADNAPLTLASTKGVWRLATNDVGYEERASLYQGFTFAAVEAI